MRNIPKFNFLFFLFFIALTCNAQFFKINKKKNKAEKEEVYNFKIWEDTDHYYRIYKVGDISAHAIPIASRNGNSKEWQVNTGYREPGGTMDAIDFEFRGECAEQVLVTGKWPLNWNSIHPSNQEFLKTKDFEDIIYIKYLEPLIVALKNQCDELKSIRLKFQFSRDQVYEGQMDKENNWELTDGFSDKIFQKSLNIKSDPGFFNTNFFVSYQGGCENDLDLYLQGKTNNILEMKHANFINYDEIIQSFAKKIAIECSTVNKLNFRLQYVPEGWRCKPDSPFTLVAIKNNNKWSVSRENFERDVPKVRVSDYKQFLQLIEQDNFDPLEDYENSFKILYVSYLEAYGTYCKNKLKDYSTYEVQSVEYTYDSNRVVVNEQNVGPKQNINIEDKFYDTYIRFSSANKLYGVQQILAAAARNPRSGVQDWYSNTKSNNNQVINFIKENCPNNRVETIYDKLNKIAANIK